MLTKIRKLLKGKLPPAVEIEKAAATIDLGALEATLAEAQQARAAILLDGSVDDILAAERVVDTARIELERAQVALAELDRRRVDAELRGREDAFLARRDACEARRIALVERLDGEVAEAARVVDAAMKELQAVEDEMTEISLATHNDVGTGNRIELAKIPETLQTWLNETQQFPDWIRAHINTAIHKSRRPLRFWE